jgi:hypothetical protein
MIKGSEWCCAWAGKTPGGIGFALIFLVLFASRQKERKAKIEGKLQSIYSLHKNRHQWKHQKQKENKVFVTPIIFRTLGITTR